MLSANNFKKNILKIVVEKCAHLPQTVNRIRPVEMKMYVRDLFHENHLAVSMEFKTWTDIHRVRSELDFDLNLGYVMSNFDGFNSYQCLDHKEIECEEHNVEVTLTTVEKIPRKMIFTDDEYKNSFRR